MSTTNISDLPGAFPAPETLSAFADSEALDVAKAIEPQLTKLLVDPRNAKLETIFHPDAFWRDLVALSWSLRTFHPLRSIAKTVTTLLERIAIVPASVQLIEEQLAPIQLPNGVSVVRIPFSFTSSNPKTHCTAAFKVVRLKSGEVKVFTVTTALRELEAVPWGKFDAPLEVPETISKSLDVLVVGGGHAGLGISAYLKALGINFAIVEKNPAIGDSWAQRYDSTTLHTTRVFSGLPFVGFPTDYPEFVPAKLIAQYYTDYVKQLHLPAYAGRNCVAATWDASEKVWDVTLEGDATGTETVKTRLLLFATGIGGRFPHIPDFPGRETFKGENIHSAAYVSASRWTGKRVVIVGASTTACDVAQDCVRAGVESVTMVQRGPTRIYPQQHIFNMLTHFWNDQIPVEVGDVMATEDPMVLNASLSALALGFMKDAHDPEYYDGLKRAGFVATVEGSVHQQIYCRAGAHYPDIGACPMISNGEIKVKSGATIEAIQPAAIALSDGSRLDADVIVYCTGFEKDSRKTAATIVGSDIANKLEPVWGLDAEGEVRGCWRPSGDERIWFHGGELQTMRYYGQFLAMQIAAELAGIRPTPWLMLEAFAPFAETLMAAVSSIKDLPGGFPPLDALSIQAFKQEEAIPVVQSLLPKICSLLSDPRSEVIEELLYPGAFWRDQVALTWSLRTFHSVSVIVGNIPNLLRRANVVASSIKLVEEQVAAVDLPNGVSIIRAPFAFATSNPRTRCTATVKLIRMKNGDVKVFTVTTTLRELDDVPWKPFDAPQPVLGSLPETVDVLVIGGGHAGLSISASLKALGIDFAMVERDPEIGDSWSKRYDSLTLHTTRVASGLPFVGLPQDYPEYVPAKLVAQYYRDYVKKLSLPAYPGRECVSAVWDADANGWKVLLRGANGIEAITARTLVFATGSIGRFPSMPDFPGKETFKGTSLHSVDYKSAAQWAGKRVAVIGAGTTGCDVALDCARAGAEVTLVQRRPTRVFRQADSTTVHHIFWNDDLPLQIGDDMAAEDAIVLASALSQATFAKLSASHDPEFYAQLERAGFLVDTQDSLLERVYIYAGSLYIDIGACGAISRGEIKVKSGTHIDCITHTGIAFSDGSSLNADVLVYCTGYVKDTRQTAATIVGDQIAYALEPVLGLDAEGEVRGVARPSGNDNIWFHVGETRSLRYNSKLLAMQIAAYLEGIRPPPVRMGALSGENTLE
ncbi:hypothetical protein HMN09_00880100 [Mycena chlorophos]|uniref:FAD/NAD(P)-binding domain-containing protein n=1 Tax=Mycena chlorophos TaxID=658473 RepID=A0A8H6SP68_MYCCL|nr:hypothetical protein HMN09_00880100 [Mycena chlorophos]